jgi:hypothetical protein
MAGTSTRVNVSKEKQQKHWRNNLLLKATGHNQLINNWKRPLHDHRICQIYWPRHANQIITKTTFKNVVQLPVQSQCHVRVGRWRAACRHTSSSDSRPGSCRPSSRTAVVIAGIRIRQDSYRNQCCGSASLWCGSGSCCSFWFGSGSYLSIWCGPSNAQNDHLRLTPIHSDADPDPASPNDEV